MFKLLNNKGQINFRVLLILLVPLIGILLPYIYTFSNATLSTNPTDWGVFGDYIGGILNPIFSLINIILLVYLTYLVSKKDDERAFEEIKYKAYKELMHQFYYVQIEKEIYFSEDLAKQARQLEKFIELYTLEFLSLFLGPEKNIIANLFGVFQATLKQMYEEYDTKNNLGKNADELLMKTLINLYSKQKQNLIEFIQASLYHHDITPYKNIDNDSLIKEAKTLAETQIKKY